MHHADFEFHLAQAGGDFAGQQPAADDDDGFFQVGHFAQGQRVPCRPQINHIAQANSGDRWPDGAAAHGETGLVEFDRLAVPQDREAAVNVQLRDHRAEARFDFVGIVPTVLEVRQFLHWRYFFAQERF